MQKSHFLYQVARRASHILRSRLESALEKTFDESSAEIFSANSIPGFFNRVNAINVPSPRQMADVLAVGLCSRDGEMAFMRFKLRIERFARNFITVWKKSRHTRSFQDVPKAVKFFINHISTRDIVDEAFPLCRTVGNLKNSFTYVKLLKSLSRLCAGEKGAEKFLNLLISADPLDPSNFFVHTALAQLLLEQGQYRKAADSALQAKRLRAMDLCISKTMTSTQKALSDNQMRVDFDHVFGGNTDRFCSLPFTLLNIFSRSREQPLVFGLCQCRGWMPMMFDTDFSWNGPDAQELRRSILDGSFRYCNELKCPHLINNDLPKRSEVADPYLREIIDNSRTELPKGPQSIILAYDTSCNLSCPSCRDKVYAADSKTTQYFNETMDKILPSLLIDAKTVQFSQVSEALSSLHHRRLLKSIMPSKYPNLTITLMTNLKLISQRTWDELGSSADCIKTLLVSIDGATPQTLERLRRGLTWQRVIEAMEFLREMRKNGKIDYIVVIFIVQKDNFRELSQILEFCSLYCVDHLCIARISSHGSYTNEQFRDIDVGDPSHPFNGEYHTAIENLKVLHKQMENSKRELLGLGRSIPTVSCQTI